MDRVNALFLLILSLVSELFSPNNETTHREIKNCARDRVKNATLTNFGITYGHRNGITPEVPKNRRLDVPGPIKGGDGVVILGRNTV